MFSHLAQECIADPGNTGPLAGATHIGRYGQPGEGPYVLLWLHVDDLGSILEASHSTNGCPAIIACASLACRILKGRTLAQAYSLEAEDISRILGGLPEGTGDRPGMVVNALKQALGGSK